MRCFTRWMEKSIFVLGILVYGWIVGLVLFMENIKYSCNNKYALSNGMLIVIGIFVIIALILLYIKYKDKISVIFDKQGKYICILSVILFFVELILSYEIMFAPGWDAREVSWQAGVIASGVGKLDNDYFSHYPNNLMLTFLYSLAYRLTGLFGLQMYGSVLIVLVQCFLSVFTGYLLYQVSKNMFHSEKISFLIWLIYSLWAGLLPWYMITYSDPVGIFFPIAILWLYQSMENKKAILQKSIGIGLLSFFGYQIKPSVVIAYIAVCVVVFLRLLEYKEFVVRGKQICGLFFSFLLAFGIYQQVDLAKCMGFHLNREQELTVTHFAMMGLSQKENGIYNQEDVQYSQSFTNKAARQEANIQVAKKRIEELGFWGIVNHLAKKTLTNYNDGTFSWGKEGEFFGEEMEKPTEFFSKTFKDFYYNDGKNRVIFNTYMQFFLIMTYLGGLLNFITLFDKKRISDTSLIVMLALVGIFLFVSLFEARARYIYVYVPLYILMGVRGYIKLFGYLKKVYLFST